MTAISIQAICKNYGTRTALDNISFDISVGEVVGFLGPNGAGKSTTLKILTGFLAPTSGNAYIQDINVLENPIQAQKHIGYLPENAPLYPDMTVEEYLEYIAQIRGIGRSEKVHAIEKICTLCHIQDRRHQLIGELSKGYRQRVGLAQALLHDPPIVILDEPTTGLDPNQIVEMRGLIREIGKTKTVILSTHILSEVQLTCDRVVIINQGNIVADGKVQDIIASSTTGMNLRAILRMGKIVLDKQTIIDHLQTLTGVLHVQSMENTPQDDHGFLIQTDKDIREQISLSLGAMGLIIIEFTQQRDNLEAIFHQLTETKSVSEQSSTK
jgi:ABC-2 type transport system ATP-binding protein